jgi:hypothetical protein
MLSMTERKRTRRAMDEQPAEHRSVKAVLMTTEAGETGPLAKRNPRAEAVRTAKAKISRRRSLLIQRAVQRE